MKRQWTVAVFLGAMLLVAVAAFAGPPLICHPFDIGNAKSLPWVSHGWNLTGGEGYDTTKLASETINVLGADSTVLVHMETLRRATLYARKDPKAAKELLTRLVARANGAESAKASGALAWFDTGYLAETYKQWIGKDEQNPAAGLDGYAWVKKAIGLRGNDPQMEFAAALITLDGHRDAHQEHAQKAIAGAKSDSLLARNLSTHFIGPQSETMADMISRNLVAEKAKQ